MTTVNNWCNLIVYIKYIKFQMSIYDTFNYLYIIMSKLITKEQFQEKLNQKRESLLEQKRQKIEKEVLLILS